MANQEFQELRRQYGVKAREIASIIADMKTNLISRNNGESLYTFGYTTPGVTVDIQNTDNISELLAVDGDMNPQGK